MDGRGILEIMLASLRCSAPISTLSLCGPGLKIYKRGRRPSCPVRLVGGCMGGDQNGPSIFLIF